MHDLAWWQSAIIYEVYPRSFQNSNGDGIGDLDGIIQRLDYLVKLGVDAIWVAPIYRSPMADFGYDIADYCAVDPIFGSMQDFDRLLKEAHRRDLKLILDFVPNHSSDQHPWFLESRSSRENAKRDWYLWRDEPNNWISNFGGPGWEWDQLTNQYYCHSFLKEQPDLNWRNPAVRTAMYDALRFWLDKGVDGFRVDVMWLIIKDDQYRDNPPNPNFSPAQSFGNRLLPVYNANRPEVHEVVAEMRAIIDSYPGRVLIGEIYLPLKDLITYYGQDLDGANLPFNFLLLQCPWKAQGIAQVISEYIKMLPQRAWPNWVLGNHDNTRIATRVGPSQAAIATMLLNVEVEEGDGESMLNLYRRLIALRRAHPMLVTGQLRSVTSLENLLSYERAADNERLMVFLNLGHSSVRVPTEAGIVLAGTDSRRHAERVGDFVELRGSEGLIIKVAS